MKKIRTLSKTILVWFLLFSNTCQAANNNRQDVFAEYIKSLEKTYQCKIGVSSYSIQNQERLEYNEHEKFHMASVVKVPLLIYLAYLNDHQKLNYSERIRINNNDLTAGSGNLHFYTRWHDLDISIQDLMEAMISISDNTATDILFDIAGGPEKINQFIKNSGIHGINIHRNINQLFWQNSGLHKASHQDIDNFKAKGYLKLKSKATEEDIKKYNDKFHYDNRDTATPQAMTSLLSNLVTNKILSASNTEMVLDIMSRCYTSSTKMAHFVPKSIASIQSKTGIWNNQKYIYNNDVGIINLPKDQKIIVSIFISSDNSPKIEQLNEVIALVSKTIFDIYYFN